MFTAEGPVAEKTSVYVPRHGMSQFAIWMLAWGVSVLVVVVGLAITCYCLKKRRRQREQELNGHRRSLHIDELGHTLTVRQGLFKVLQLTEVLYYVQRLPACCNWYMYA